MVLVVKGGSAYVLGWDPTGFMIRIRSGNGPALLERLSVSTNHAEIIVRVLVISITRLTGGKKGSSGFCKCCWPTGDAPGSRQRKQDKWRPHGNLLAECKNL